jgi:hypothetical protein
VARITAARRRRYDSGVPDDDAAGYRRQAVDEPDDLLRGNLIATLAQRWPDDPRTRDLLHDLAHVDGCDANRRGVAKIVARRWPDERTCALLRDMATGDPARPVASAAAVLLAELRPAATRTWLYEQLTAAEPDRRVRALRNLRAVAPDEPGTRRALGTAAATDRDPAVRWAALTELTATAAASPISELRRRRDVFDILLGAARDPAPAVRAVAVEQLGHHRHVDRSATAAALYERVLAEDDPRVREQALRSMVSRNDEPSLWPTDPAAIDWLRRHVAAEPFAASRRWALTLLGAFVADPDVRALLGTIAERHPDEQRRRELLRLHRTDRADADTKQLARRLVRTDPSEHVRADATMLLTWYWPDDADTIELLLDRVVADPAGAVRSAGWDLLAYETDRAEVADLLTRRAADDPDGTLRRRLLDHYARQASYDPDRTAAIAFLTARADRDPDPEVGRHAAELAAALTAGRRIRHPDDE